MTCKAGDKIWPRLDNFRSHVKRMHEGEDLEQLVKRCATAKRSLPQAG